MPAGFLAGEMSGEGLANIRELFQGRHPIRGR